MKAMLQTFVAAAALIAATGAWAEPVNVNAADAATIADALKGVGPSRAQAIVTHREQHGPFVSVDALMDVKGIGEKTIADNRDDILLK